LADQQGWSHKKKRSPEKSFRENNKYTIHLPDGRRELVIENTLAGTEDAYVKILPKIQKREELDPEDRAELCVFAATMHSRTSAMGEHWTGKMQNLHEMTVNIEKAHKAEPKESLETARMVQTAHQQLIVSSIRHETPLLFQMQMTVMFTDDDVGFITSDMPCNLFNSEAYKWPASFRSPGLGDLNTEVTLPLTPQHLLVFSYNETPGYVEALPAIVEEHNWRVHYWCSKEFVSWKGVVRDTWFQVREEPQDSQ
jgi:hypothetical protein